MHSQAAVNCHFTCLQMLFFTLFFADTDLLPQCLLRRLSVSRKSLENVLSKHQRAHG